MKHLSSLLSAFLILGSLMDNVYACSYQLDIPEGVNDQTVKEALAKITSQFDLDSQTKIVHFKLDREVSQKEVETSLRDSGLSVQVQRPPKSSGVEHEKSQ